MIYTSESFKNRFVVFFEAAGIRLGIQDYVMRTLMSEGCIKYDFTDPNTYKVRRIEKEGPTGFITTTTKTFLNKENETRYLSIQSDDSPEQTKRILKCIGIGRVNAGVKELVDLKIWQAFQEWLKYQDNRVVIPYADVLAEMVDTNAPRIRRDFTKVLNLIEAHTIMHQRNRERNDDGRIRATFCDYEAVFNLISHIVAAGVESALPCQVRVIVEAVRQMKSEKPDHSISYTDVAKRVDMHRSTVNRWVRYASDQGYLINLSENPRKADLVLGEPLPEDKQVLPSPDELNGAFRKAFLERRRKEALLIKKNEDDE